MLFIALICLLLPLSALPFPIEVHEPHIDVDHYKYITNEVLFRPKRSGSFDFVGAIKNTITSHIGKASASSAGASSSSSSKTVVVEKPIVTIEKDLPFDGWQLKKSILNTIFQAVKAIAGGVTAINGQLIKGGGHLLSQGGNLIAASGDTVTNVGKNIALSAKLLPAEKPIGIYKHFGASSHSGPGAEEFTSFGGHEVLDEYVGPHELPVYAPQLPPASYLPPVPVDIPLDAHYQNVPPPVGHTHYGPPPIPYSHNPNYLDRKAEALSYDDKVDPTPLTATDTFDSTPHKRAIEALQSLLRKLPNKLTAKDHINDIDSIDIHGHENDINTPPKQYNIPKDPTHIPEFKPIKAPAITSTYTFQLGPIETVTKHTIGGGGGSGANTNHAGATFAAPNGKHSKYTIIQNPVPNYTIQTSIQSQRPSSSHSQAVNQPPLNLYHTMTLKNGHGQQQQHQHQNHRQPQQSTLLYLPGEKQPYNIQGIQKSIEYRIQ